MLVFLPLKQYHIHTVIFQALDYLLSNGETQDAESFIDKKGLKYVFPALLGKVGCSICEVI